KMKQSLPQGVEIKNHVFRQADFIDASIDNLSQTLMEGAFFVVIVLFIFLMNWRTTIISLMAIPMSLLVSVIILKLLGYSINTMSLGGMAIAIGALVDDAIIDVENVFKRLRQNSELPENERKGSIEVVRDASVEIRSSIIIATLIIIVSFVPLFFLSGMEGRLLTPLGIAFITSVLTSLIVAVTLTPVMCSYLLTRDKLLKKQSKGTFLERWLQKSYAGMIQKTLQYSRWVIGLTFAVFVGSLLLFYQLGRTFLPEFNEGSMVISAVGMPGMSLEESNKMGRKIEELLLALPEVDVVTRRTGRAELDEHAQGVHASEIDAPFTLEEGGSKEALFERVRAELAKVPGVNITIGQPIAHRIDHMLSGTRANIAVKVFGEDLTQLFSLCKDIESIAEDIPGLTDIAVEPQLEVPQIRIEPRRTMLAGYGMTVQQLMQFVETALGGHEVGQIYEGQKYFDLVVRYPEEYRTEINKINGLLVDVPGGKRVPITDLANIASVSSPNQISRENAQRKVVVSANVQGRDLRGAVNELREKVASGLDLPQGYRVEYGGQFESEARASQMLMGSAAVAILIIYLLLYFELKDTKLALIVLLNLPLALIGGILIVYFTSGIVSIAGIIGFISLFGIATRNGLLLISRYQDLEAEGEQGNDLIVKGSLDRLNPIIMTALTTALALIPLALKGGEPGNEIQSPMAVVILGGLLTATVLNLLVIPSVYQWMVNGRS
ncbi:MAG TPA: efflux RND transporter permease subunit, partial [Saprospiraceae bacterium]|nr:efflux RND transporter permease subunit [Saprospiraceae bacterium]